MDEDDSDAAVLCKQRADKRAAAAAAAASKSAQRVGKDKSVKEKTGQKKREDDLLWRMLRKKKPQIWERRTSQSQP